MHLSTFQQPSTDLHTSHADQIHAVSDTYRANIAVQTHWHFRCQSLKTDRPSIQVIVAPIQQLYSTIHEMVSNPPAFLRLD